MRFGGSDALLGVWKLDARNLKFEEEITITFEKGEWKLTGVYKMGGKEVGRWHGEKIALAKGTLHYTQVVDEKPPFDLFPNTSGVLSAKDDKGKAEYTSRTEKSSRFWHSADDRIEKQVAVADPSPMSKVYPKLEPKVEPKMARPREEGRRGQRGVGETRRHLFLCLDRAREREGRPRATQEAQTGGQGQ